MELLEELDRLFARHGFTTVIYAIPEVLEKIGKDARSDIKRDFSEAADIINRAYQEIRRVFGYDYYPDGAKQADALLEISRGITKLVELGVANSLASGKSLPENTRNQHRE